MSDRQPVYFDIEIRASNPVRTAFASDPQITIGLRREMIPAGLVEAMFEELWEEMQLKAAAVPPTATTPHAFLADRDSETCMRAGCGRDPRNAVHRL